MTQAVGPVAITSIMTSALLAPLVDPGSAGYGTMAALLPALDTNSRALYAVVGVRKPDAEIYVLAAESVGLEPEACVFVDDLPGNLKPAAQLGMATVHHAEAADTVAELERLLGVPLA